MPTVGMCIRGSHVGRQVSVVRPEELPRGVRGASVGFRGASSGRVRGSVLRLPCVGFWSLWGVRGASELCPRLLAMDSPLGFRGYAGHGQRMGSK